ncbi:MAG: hypothetical protein P8016_09465 [Sedimentisphaerales bacterium]
MKIKINNLPKDLRDLFKADGLKGIPSPFRSPWFDAQEKIRKGNKRDFICNVCGVPLGATETPFDHAVLEEIRKKFVRPADFRGELYFEFFSNGRINSDDISFLKNETAGRFHWWGKLPFGRPEQRHNYIIAVDPSYGLGSANSVACVYDRNTYEQVGIFVDANTKPEQLADVVVAMAYWCGGIQPTYVIWDAGGGCGTTFTNRVVYHRYPFVYTQRREDSKTRKITQKLGCMCTGKAKNMFLGELGVALSGSLIPDDDYKVVIVHDKETLEELFDYIFKENSADIVASCRADLSTGAAERHGDRVIALALCVLACRETIKGSWQAAENPPINSFQSRFNQVKEELAAQADNQRKFLF